MAASGFCRTRESGCRSTARACFSRKLTPACSATHTSDEAPFSTVSVRQPRWCMSGTTYFKRSRNYLGDGQPAEFAGIPTLDLHIALLRELIVTNGVSLVEIPPVPEGYPCIACLTHDVDHPWMRRHILDHTALGFLYRALFSTPAKWLRGEVALRDVVANWRAVLKLPLVAAGIATDPWACFAKRYAAAEEGLPATYFLIPFRKRPGKGERGGNASGKRGASYRAAELGDMLADILSAGNEIALHGIDAWTDAERAAEEFEEIRRITGAAAIGVRMHWLFFGRRSPQILEQAQADYDSTLGYRETVGFRAGTMQAYKPMKSTELLELPLHAMDTALFYPTYLRLSPRQAGEQLHAIAAHARQAGGCFTINWHDRSLAPERLWYRCYQDIICELREQGAWFATAGQAIRWFRKRRSVIFEHDDTEAKGLRARVTADDPESPALRLRVYRTRLSEKTDSSQAMDYVDLPFTGTIAMSTPHEWASC